VSPRFRKALARPALTCPGVGRGPRPTPATVAERRSRGL